MTPEDIIKAAQRQRDMMPSEELAIAAYWLTIRLLLTEQKKAL